MVVSVAVADVARSRTRLAVAAIVLAAFAIHALLGLLVTRPWVFPDELDYAWTAHSIARSGSFAVGGVVPGTHVPPLFPLLLSPIYALTDSAQTAYVIAKILGAGVMSLAAIPAYALARPLLSRNAALAVAALSVLAPLGLYSTLLLTETLAYPLVLGAAAVTLRAVRRPGLHWSALATALAVAAALARRESVFVLPAVATALLLARPRCWRTFWPAWAAALAEVVLLALIKTGAVQGFAIFQHSAALVQLPSARALTAVVQQGGGVDLAVGVVPFAGAVASALTVRRIRGFGAVATSFVFWTVVAVAVNAAAVGGNQLWGRYLIYVVPFFLIALLAGAEHASRRVAIAAAVAAAAAPVLVPLGADINDGARVETFSLIPFAHVVGGHIEPIPYARLVVALVAVLLAMAFLYARADRTSLLVTIAAVAIVGNVFAFHLIRGAARSAAAALPAPVDWVDTAKPHGVVAALGIAPDDATHQAFLQTYFFNWSITSAYRVSTGILKNSAKPLVLGPHGVVRVVDGTPLQASFAVTALPLVGHVVASNSNGKVRLVRLRGGMARVGASTP